MVEGKGLNSIRDSGKFINKSLSGGQQQKVALLRSLLKKSQIRLLDEATASLDSCAARQMLEKLLAREERVTTLMITHKLTEACLADEIIVLGEGKVLAQGAHAELLEKSPLYQTLWNASQKTQDRES